MEFELLDFDDWGRFTLRGLLLVVALTVVAFVGITAVFGIHGLLTQPQFGSSTTAIVAQPRSPSQWFGLAALFGVMGAMATFVVGLAGLGLAAFLIVLGKAAEAREVMHTSTAHLAIKQRRRAEKIVKGGENAT